MCSLGIEMISVPSKGFGCFHRHSRSWRPYKEQRVKFLTWKYTVFTQHQTHSRSKKLGISQPSKYPQSFLPFWVQTHPSISQCSPSLHFLTLFSNSASLLLEEIRFSLPFVQTPNLLFSREEWGLCQSSFLHTNTFFILVVFQLFIHSCVCVHRFKKISISLYLCNRKWRFISTSILLLPPQNTSLITYINLHNFTVLNCFDFILSKESGLQWGSSWDHKFSLLKLCQTLKLPTTPFTHISIIIMDFTR